MVEEINREDYSVNGYTFRGFNTLTLEEKKMVLEWRNTESIRKWMYNTEPIDLESHLKFIEGLGYRDDRYYWLVFSPDGDAIGVVNVTDVNRTEDKAELGYYARPDSSGEGFDFVRQCYYFFFVTLEIKNFYGAVDPANTNAYLLDMFLGCIFTDVKELNGNKYYTTTNLKKDLFLEKYELTMFDYLKFVRQWKLKNS